MWAVEVDVRQGVDALTALVGAGLGVFPGAGGVKDAQRAWKPWRRARFLAAEPLSAEIAAVCEAADVTTMCSTTTGQMALTQHCRCVRPFCECAAPESDGRGVAKNGRSPHCRAAGRRRARAAQRQQSNGGRAHYSLACGRRKRCARRTAYPAQ
ncbi:MAG: hypothetical protein WKH64_15375 [Chloroflexia bacterium]